MDILWILWTIPAVIAVEGKLMFSQTVKAASFFADFEFETKRVNERLLILITKC